MGALDVCYAQRGVGYAVYRLKDDVGLTNTARSVQYFNCQDANCSVGCYSTGEEPVDTCQPGQVSMMQVLTNVIPKKKSVKDHLIWNFAGASCASESLYKIEFFESTCYSEGP